MNENNTSGNSCSISWKEGGSGVLAGFLAALCCAVPPFLGVLGFTGLAGILGAMPFTYHLVLQWLALGLVLITWGWYGWKLKQMTRAQRSSPRTIIVGILLILVSLYVVKTWYAHMFLMG